MEDDQIFIDNLVKNSIADYKVQPHTSWDEMEMKMKKSGIVSKSKNINTNIAIISGIFVITAGVIFFNNETENQSGTKETFENVSDTAAVKEKIIPVIKIEKEKTSKDSVSEINTKIHDSNKNETVTIKVEVPVHKKVVIKKQIIIKDTLK